MLASHAHVAECGVIGVADELKGEVVRGTIKKMADGVDYRIPPTIEDASVIDEIEANLNALGYPRV